MSEQTKEMEAATPGPWRVESNHDGSLVQVFGGKDFDSCVVSLAFETPEGDLQKQNMGDAHLIAAAPDLLKALDDLLALDARDSGTSKELTVRSAAWSALAKARGGK